MRKRQWANQLVVGRRLDVFADVAPGLNQLLCFATFVGSWKEIQPLDAIAIKRKLDNIMYTNQVLFASQLSDAYHQFMNTLFAMWNPSGGDAMLRVRIESPWGNRRYMPWWDESMAIMSAPPTTSPALMRSETPTISSLNGSALSCTLRAPCGSSGVPNFATSTALQRTGGRLCS